MRGAPLALGRLSSLSAAATLFLAACGGGAAQPTAAPAPPTTAPAPTKPAAAATIPAQDLGEATDAQGAWDAAKEAENANQALNDADVMVYLGTFNSGAAKVSIPILCKTNLGMISPANTYPGLTKKIEGAVEANEPDVYYEGCKRNYTRVVPSDEIQGAAAAKWSKD